MSKTLTATVLRIILYVMYLFKTAHNIVVCGGGGGVVVVYGGGTDLTVKVKKKC